MIATPVLVLMMMLGGNELAEARQAFAEGRYDVAERLALDAAGPSQSGAALYLVGLSRFRSGRPAEALEALDAAGRAEDPPEHAAWSFNRGACLYALERFSEAEQAFVEAASDASLARLAWVNAGFAALDAGSPERALEWAERARPGASEQELVQVEDLISQANRARGLPAEAATSEYQQGLAAFDAGRFEEARTHFLQATRETPSPGRAWLMAGASSYRMGDRGTAREDIATALALPLEPQDARIAHDYLDRLSLGLRGRGQGWGSSLNVAPGYDSNVFQVGVAARDVSLGRLASDTGSLFAEAGVSLVARRRLSDTLFAELSYGGLQRVYTVSSAQDYSLQLHRAAAAVEWEGSGRWRLGAAAAGDVFFTGLSDFRGLQASGMASAWAALDESEWTSTRLDASFSPKLGLGSEFDYLSGQRLEATLSQELRLRGVAVTARYGYREDRIGTLVQSASTDAGGVSQEYVIPYAWTGHAVGTSVRVAPFAAWEARLDASLEWRRYLSDSYLRVQLADGTEQELGHRRREDVRLLVGPAVSVRLTKNLQLAARYDLLVNTSNVDTRLTDAANACTAPDFVCHRYDYTNGNYQKHQVMLELGATW